MKAADRSWGFGRIRRLATKELRETLRDRRTIATLVLMPLLVYPILSLVFQNFLLTSAGVGNLQGEDEEFVYNILFTSNLDDEAARKFLGEISYQLKLFDDQEAAKERSVARNVDAETNQTDSTEDYRVVPKTSHAERPFGSNNWLFLSRDKRDELTDSVADGSIEIQNEQRVIDVGIDFEINPSNRHVKHFEIVHRRDGYSVDAAAYVQRRFEQFNHLYAERVLTAERLELPISEPHVKVIEIGEEQGAGGTIASLIPLALVLMTITGAVYPSIDLTAGERERGTLETLMAAPVPRMGILLAKFTAVVTVAVLTAILNLIGMTIVMWVFQLDQMLPGGGLTVGIIVKVFLLLVLFAAFFAACLLMVTSFARSFKEAQAYLVPIILLSLGPGLLAMSPDVTLGGMTAVTPMMNLLVLARDVMQGRVETAPAAIAIVSTLVYAFVALSIAARTFGTDSILYAQEASLSSLFIRPRKSVWVTPMISALLCLALLLPVNMVAIGVLGRLGQQLQEKYSLLCLLMAAFTILSFFIIPSVVAWINRVKFPSGFGLRGSPAAYFVAAVILGVSLWPIVMLMVEATYAIYGMIAGEAAASARHDMLVELSGDQVERFRQVSPLLIAICFSIVPAFCEEWFFRGMLLRALVKEWKPSRAIFTTAILFGVFHILSSSAVSLDRFLPTMLVGILLGYLAWKSNSLWPGVVLHSLHNATVVFLGYYQEKLSELPWFPSEAEQIPWTWGAAAAVLVAIGLWIVWKSKPAGSGFRLDTNTAQSDPVS